MRAVLTGIFIIIVSIVFVTAEASAFEPAKGQRSIVKSLGQSSDFERVGNVFLPNRNAWGQTGKQGDISYRMLKKKAEAEVFIFPVDFDNKGLPKNNMVLEILYKDHVWQKKKNKSETDERVRIKFRTDFGKDNQYEEVGYLKAEGDDKWKVAHIFCEQTPRQIMRAIDGSFQIKILMPRGGSREVPISYIRLISMDQREFLKLREQERSSRGLIRVEYIPEQKKANPPDKWKKLGFVIYPTNYLQLVFPNSVADYEHAGLPLECFEIPGQIEPVSFVVHALEEMSAINVKVTNLQFEKNIISVEMVDIRRVCFNDQRWGWSWAKKYGKCPDYLSFSNPDVDIPMDTNCQFWLSITIPEVSPAGLYKGKVTVYAKDEELYEMELSVDVLPVKLQENQVKHLLYHSPYWRSFHRDRIRVLHDMKRHGLVPIFYPPIGLVRSGSQYIVELDDFDYQLQAFEKVYPEAEEMFITLMNPRNVWRKLKGPKPEFTSQFLEFEQIYGKILKQCSDLGKTYGLEIYFSFEDEPFKHPDRRRVAYLCSRIARSKGFKTWSTHNLNDDIQLELSQKERNSNANYLRPLRGVLDLFVEYVGRVDSNAIRVFKDDKAKLSYYTTYHATSIRPTYNRFLHGIYPFIMQSQFVFSYAYRDSILNPYDDMDTRTSHLKVIGMNDYVLTYPTWRGDILPTLSYESLREGVEDSHLISTLHVLIDKALQSDNPETLKLGRNARDYLEGISARVGKGFRGRYYKGPQTLLVDAGEKVILRDLNGARDEGYDIFNEIRRGICDRIMELQVLLS